MGSKYFDLVIAAFMAYFAYTRFVEGQTGFAVLFVVLFILNILTFTVKLRKEKQQDESNLR